MNEHGLKLTSHSTRKRSFLIWILVYIVAPTRNLAMINRSRSASYNSLRNSSVSTQVRVFIRRSNQKKKKLSIGVIKFHSFGVVQAVPKCFAVTFAFYISSTA